ncbi:MAG: MBL fold metallo-hydrolase [Myxococcota bacterium]
MRRVRQPGRRPKGVVTRGRVARRMAFTMLMPMRRVPKKFAPGQVPADQTAVTYVGHATALVQTAGMNVITDPIFASRILLLRRLVEPGVAFSRLPKIDLIVLSHAHLDHCDVPTLRRFRKDTPIVCPRGVGDLPKRAGLRNILEVDLGEGVRVGDLKITSIPVRHFGQRFFLDTHRGYTAFLIEGGSRSVFFGGDTAYDKRFGDIGKKHDIDIALIPIGAYRPDTFRGVHCNPPDAIQAFQELRANWLIPIHWGTFVLSYEPVEEPIEWLEAIRDEQELEEQVVILRHGERQIF